MSGHRHPIRRPTAAELEREAAALPPPAELPPPAIPSGVRGLLLRRGIPTEPSVRDLPFDAEDPTVVEPLLERLDHYAFRLFLRGAISHRTGFEPHQATRYLEPKQALEHADWLTAHGLATRLADGRYRLVRSAGSFGDTLEWYVAAQLERRYGFDTATGLKLAATGLGGDLDVAAAADGRLVFIELKSSPPKHLEDSEVSSFFHRVASIRPEVALFAVDTALRLEDRVLPMLRQGLEAARGAPAAPPREVARQLWAFTDHLYAVNADRNLIANLAGAIAAGFRGSAPRL